MKKVLQFLLGLILPVFVFIGCLAVVRQFTTKGFLVVLGLYLLISLLILFFRKYKLFIFSYLIIFFWIAGYTMVKKVEWKNNFVSSENIIKKASKERSYETEENMEVLFTKIEDFPSDWGQIYVSQSDTFKYLDCSVYTTVNILQQDSLFLLTYNSYYYGNDSLIINYFYQESNENFIFKIKANSSEETTWTFKLTDRENLIGNLYDSKERIYLQNLIANFSKKNYPDIKGPCAD